MLGENEVMERKNGSLIFFLGLSCLLSFITPCFSTVAFVGSLSQGEQLKHGQVLVSDSSNFTLGFLSLPPNNNSFYLAIWYSLEDQAHPVWIANRNTPIFDDSAVLNINDEGSLEIKYGNGSTLPLYMVENATTTTATLQDDGNFVLRENGNSTSDSSLLWQSFDYPTDTLLPGMKLGFNRRTGHNWYLTSWRNAHISAFGSFSLGIDPNNTKQLVIRWRGEVFWRSGEWQEKDSNFKNLTKLSEFYPYPQSQNYYNGEPGYSVDYMFHYNSTEDEIYFTYSVNMKEGQARNIYDVGLTQQLPRFILTYEGNVLKGGGESAVSCSLFSSDSADPGCMEDLPDCRISNDSIQSSRVVMLTEGFKYEESENLSLYDCKAICLRGCACIAFASTNNLSETGCEIWSSGATLNYITSPDGQGRNVYMIHVIGVKKIKWWNYITPIVLGVVLIGPLLCLAYGIRMIIKRQVDKLKRRKLREEGQAVASIVNGSTKRHKKDGKTNNEIHKFSFQLISTVTNNFSTANKLGEGGYGPVYKGIILDEHENEHEIAIKRLSKKSRQGMVEFDNEARVIAKLQHTNLVRLLGFCVESDERILVYEYMPNKSLDYYLFDSEKRKMLNWERRHNIIKGIAQGMVYLHEYSRLTVIHRDLKASNILLDNEMNPKISDFGMAKICELKGIEENTSRIVGTYGYMSPEYAMNGVYSLKTDVFSFGVLVLEIVSGKKNNSRDHSDSPLNLIGLVWGLWNEGRAVEIIDSSLLESCHTTEVLRCIQAGLLCVQDLAGDRPNMLEVVSMLSNETARLLEPKEPAIYINIATQRANEKAEKLEIWSVTSVNQVTISELDGR